MSICWIDRVCLAAWRIVRRLVRIPKRSFASLAGSSSSWPWRGPLNVFGPYSETKGAMDKARSRSVPAYFQSEDGGHFLFVTGQSRINEHAMNPLPPALHA